MGRSRHGGLSALHSPNYAQFCKKANFERARYTFVDAKSPAPLSLSMTPNVKPSKASRSRIDAGPSKPLQRNQRTSTATTRRMPGAKVQENGAGGKAA